MTPRSTPGHGDPTDGPTSTSTASPDPADEETGPPDGRKRRTLPIGPLGLFLATAVALAAAGFVVWLGTRSDSGAVPVTDVLDQVEGSALVPTGTDPVAVGDPAPDVRLELLDGTTSSLAAFRGRPLVVNFWSSTCAPCLKEMPDLEQVSNDHASDLAVLGVDVTDTAEAGRKMVAQTAVTYPNARDPQADIFAAFGGTALPRTVLVDADGTVVEVHNGALTASELTDLLRDRHLLG